MKKNKTERESIRRAMKRVGWLYSIFFIVVILVTFLIRAISLWQNLSEINRVAVNAWAEDLAAAAEDGDEYVRTLYSSSDYVRAVKRHQSALQVILNEEYIYDLFDAKITASQKITGMFIYDSAFDLLRSRFNAAQMDGREMQLLNRELHSYIRGTELNPGRWIPIGLGDRHLLIKTYASDQMCIGLFIDLDHVPFARLNEHGETEDSDLILIYNQEGLVSSDTGKIQLPAAEVTGERNRVFLQSGLAVISRCIDSLGIWLVLLTPIHQFFKLYVYEVIELAMITAAFIAFRHIISGMLNRLVTLPVQELTGIAERMRRGQYFREDSDAEPSEYIEIKNNLEEIITQIRGLENERIQKEREIQRARLQYYQLQTKPHFFLNCLKNIYALAETGDLDRIKILTLGISSHFRYIFKDNLQLVSLSEELDEVENYIRFQQVMLPAPIVMDMRIDHNADSFRIPTLLLQTFIENAIKYAAPEGTLVIRILTALSEEEEELLTIHIEDNGKGFPEDIMQQVATDEAEGFASHHVGLRNLRSRLKILYGDRAEMNLYNLSGAGACADILLHQPRLAEGEMRPGKGAMV